MVTLLAAAHTIEIMEMANIHIYKKLLLMAHLWEKRMVNTGK
jgi:hypothetical protein